MGTIDWIILGFLLLFTIFGWRKGFAAAVVQFTGYVLTFFLVGHYYPLLQRNLVLKYHIGRGWAIIFSVLLIIVLIIVVVRLIIYLLNKVLGAMKLSTLNKAAGAVLGFMNGLLIIIILSVMLDFLPKLSAPLKDGGKHRVYAGINVLKEELFTKLKLTQRMKLIKMPKIPGQSENPPEYKEKK